MSVEHWIRFIMDELPGVESEIADGNTFFFEGADHRMPLATLVTNDLYDTVSNLSRPGIYRLNIGVGSETFRELCGSALQQGDEIDFSELGCWMPHPAYGSMNWICILNPGDDKEQQVKGALKEAHQLALKRQARRDPKE